MMENGDRNSVSPLEIVSTPELELESRHSSLKNSLSSRPQPLSRPVTDNKRPGSVKESSGLTGDPTAVRLLLLAEIVIIVCFLIFVRYSDDVSKGSSQKSGTEGRAGSELSHYPLFQDVHVMIFIGFGYLMTFLRRFGYSALGYNMALAAIAIQWSVLCRGIFNHEGNQILVSLYTLINGDFAAAAVLISFGAVLGVTSMSQLLFVALVEVFLYSVNEYIGTVLLQAVDIGGSMFIHTFGAYFGLAMSYVSRRQQDCQSGKEESSYTSDLFAMIGTLFLWMYWPSFNGALAEEEYQHRAIVNTTLSLTASCLFSFALSAIVSSDNRFSMVHVQNATLAGGVAIGAIADLFIQPYGSLLVGGFAGILSTAGYVYITPALQDKLGLHDTCGVNNLHGMPGIVSGLLGALMAALATEDDYGRGLYVKYPARAPFDGTRELTSFQQSDPRIAAGLNRSATEQAIYQLAALGISLLIGIVGGAITGVILRIPLFHRFSSEDLFEDSKMWDTAAEKKDDPQ